MERKIATLFAKKSTPFKTFVSLLFFVIALLGRVNAQNTITYTTSGSNSWVCPTGVTSVTVECWGGGGGGGGVSGVTGAASGGGAGGSYTKMTGVSVTPGSSYNCVVGAGGASGANTGTNGGTGASSTFNTTTVVAVGGLGGIGATTVTGATGGVGTTTGNTAGTNYAGGTGATGVSASYGGGGGAAAGNAAVGGNGSGSTPGAGGGAGGGTGGTGVTSANGTAGSTPGGGGGGTRANNTNGRKGGTGGVGQIILTYTCPAQTYAALPYTQDFESAWVDKCIDGVGTLRAPDQYWADSYGGTGPSANDYWHRDDYTGSDWSSPTGGAYSPTGSGSSHSARFHNEYAPSGSLGNFDLYVNLSTGGMLSFDYINLETSANSLTVLLSTDGGSTFPTTIATLTNNGSNSTWVSEGPYALSTTSATCVIRFQALSDYGLYDMGIDNISISNPTPNCAGLSSPANSATNVNWPATLTWTTPTLDATHGVATAYKVYFGTDNPPTNIVNGTSQPGLTYTTGTLTANTTYYWKIIASNSSGDATSCSTYSFTTNTLPGCATYSSPSNGASSVATSSSLTWTAPSSGGTPSGYKLYLGTDNPPTNVINGTNVGNVLTYHPPLNGGLTYYWKIVPTNSAGDGSCSTVWSFATVPATTFTVPGSYATIRLAYDACTAASPYIIEIQPSYAGEAYPILLGSANAGNRSATNNITIRPAVGETYNFKNTGTETSLFEFNGAKWVVIDGAGSSGITMENTQTAAGKWVISMHGGATNNTVQYCTIKGSNADATAASANAGLIRFADGTNSNNTIDHCTITLSGTNKPAVGILSYDGTNNNLLTITNNSFVDITRYGIWASGSKNTGWTISSNNFYQSGAVVPAPAVVMAAIQIDNGGGYTVSGNNIGGQAGGSSPYTVTGDGTSAFVGINFAGSTAATTNTVSSNTINDISISLSADNTATPFCFTGINAAGSASFNIGSSGSANTIGDMTGITHKIAITSTHAITNGFSAINNTATGTTNITYNNIGSIDLSGISTVCSNNVNIIRNSNASGTITIDNNTIGNTTADNMNMGVQTTSLIYNQASAAAATFSVTNNTIQKIKYTGSGSFYGVYNGSCILTCTGNTISGINSTGSSTTQYCIYHNISSKVATISSNIINTITTSSASSAFTIIYLNAASATSSISSNTIGNSLANNISLAGNTEEYAIQIMDGGTVTCNANTLKNITLTSTGSDNVYYGLTVGSSSTKGAAVLNATNNTITDITTSSTSSHANESFAGLRLYSTGSGHTITNNVFQRIISIGASSMWCEVNAISIRNGTNGTVTKNLITDLTTSNANANMHAICFDENGAAGGTWNFYNNAIVLNSSTNGYVEGLHFYGTGVANTGVFYHNTIKISGTTAASVTSEAFGFDVDQGTYTMKNNVFQNLRTGGTANYAIENLVPYAITESHDYLQASDASKIGHYGSTAETFAAWNTAVGSSGNINGNSTPVTLDGNGIPPEGAPLKNAGVNLFSTVPDDRLGASRSTTPYLGAYEPPDPLPINLLFFSGHKIENSVMLVWETANEINNNHFTIEKSLDGNSFESIAIIIGAGNSNSLLNYEVYDNNPYNGINYYRLKQTDFDGKYTYSSIIAVNFKNDKEEINIYPNPFNDRTNVYFSDNEHLPFNIEMFDALGKIVREEKQITGNIFVIEKEQLKSGIYTLRIYNDKQSIIKKVIIK